MPRFTTPSTGSTRSDPRKIYLSMRVHGLTSASDLDVNLNRCIVRYHKVKVSERASTKVPDAGHAHIDANLHNVAGSAMGCKAALTPSAFAALLGCGPKTWDFLKQEFRATFATAAEGHKMLNMPTLEADTLQIQDLAKVCLSLAPGAKVIWLSSVVHSVGGGRQGLGIRLVVAVAQLHATNGQDRENVVTCLSTGACPTSTPRATRRRRASLAQLPVAMELRREPLTISRKFAARFGETCVVVAKLKPLPLQVGQLPQQARRPPVLRAAATRRQRRAAFANHQGRQTRPAGARLAVPRVCWRRSASLRPT